MSESELLSRIERLERDNRRMKGYALGTLILASALGAVYATEPVPAKLTAREFDLVDESGRVGISMKDINGPTVVLLDPQTELPRVSIGSLGESVMGIWLFEGQGTRRVVVPPEVRAGGVGVSLFDTQGEARTTISLAGDQQGVSLLDSKGFRMVLGNAETMNPRTGETQQTSAASIVMFGNDKDHHVIWKAP